MSSSTTPPPPKIRLDRFSTEGFDRGCGRAKEALWILCKALFFLLPLPLPSEFRATLLRSFGAKVGEGVVIRDRVDVKFPWRLEIGDHVWLGQGVQILNLAQVSIASHSCVSQEAFLCTGSHDFRSENFELITTPITIGKSAWIAARAFVAPGVDIGAGAMVCAGAVVLTEVPPAHRAQGNPADAHPISG